MKVNDLGLQLRFKNESIQKISLQCSIHFPYSILNFVRSYIALQEIKIVHKEIVWPYIALQEIEIVHKKNCLFNFAAHITDLISTHRYSYVKCTLELSHICKHTT